MLLTLNFKKYMKELDEVFSLFSDERRRFALYYLDQTDGEVPLDELAKQVDEWESDPQSFATPDPDYENTVISLEHNHLPKIEEATHVEYDRQNEQLRVSDMSSEMDILLSVSKAIEQPSSSDDILDSGLF